MARTELNKMADGKENRGRICFWQKAFAVFTHREKN
jgi:hypothetical protein